MASAKAARRGRPDAVTRFFHAASYLQYPLLLVMLAYTVWPLFNDLRDFWPSLNKALIWAGLAISFSTLQDTTTTQNGFSLRVWQDPRKGKAALVMIAVSTLVMLLAGLFGYFLVKEGAVKEVSIGLMMLGLGYFGLLKSAIEMFENHRQDKHPPAQ